MKSKGQAPRVAELDAPGGHVRVLNALLEMMDEREFVEGRAACVTYETELARRTGLGDSLKGVFKDVTGTRLLTSHKAAEVFKGGRPEAHMTAHPAAEIFAYKHTGFVFRLRRRDVVLAVESAGPLWMADYWVRRGSRGQF